MEREGDSPTSSLHPTPGLALLPAVGQSGCGESPQPLSAKAGRAQPQEPMALGLNADFVPRKLSYLCNWVPVLPQKDTDNTAHLAGLVLTN